MFGIAVRYFTQARGKAAAILKLSIFSTSVNIGFFVFCFAFAQGCYQTLLTRVLDMHGHAKVFDFNARYESNLVKKAFKIITLNGKLIGCNQGLSIKCLHRNDFLSLLANYIKQSDLGTKRKKIIVVGSVLAEMYQIKLGEIISVGIITDDLVQEDFYVAGITHFGLDDYDRYIVHVPIEAIPNLSGESYRAIYLKNPSDIYVYQKELASLGTYVSIWPKMFSTFMDISIIVQLLIFALLGVFILTSAIQSISGLMGLMLDKAKDMRIFSILGITNLQKFKILSSYGLFISLINTILGGGLGLLLICILNLILRKAKLGFKTNDFVGILSWQHFLLIITFAFIINIASMLAGAIYVTRKGED